MHVEEKPQNHPNHCIHYICIFTKTKKKFILKSSHVLNITEKNAWICLASMNNLDKIDINTVNGLNFDVEKSVKW